MPLKADNSKLPKGGAEVGNIPDPHPRFGQLLAEAWWDRLTNGEPHQKSRDDVEHYIRLGWGGQCARKIGYQLLDVPRSNPPDIAAIWRMELGTQVHGLLQEVMPDAFPGASIEHVIGKEHDEIFGFPVSGRTDVFLAEYETTATPEEVDAGAELGVAFHRVAIEVKTINGFGFKMSVGARGAAQGPRSGAIFQGAMNGRALNADEVVIVLLSLECLSDRELTGLAKKTGGEPDPVRKFVAEWTFQMKDLDELVDRELKRLAKIIELVQAIEVVECDECEGVGGIPDDEPGSGHECPKCKGWGKFVTVTAETPLPPRSIPLEMPARARVTDPRKGAWSLVIDGNVMDAGEYWGCSYCDFQDRCIADGPS